MKVENSLPETYASVGGHKIRCVEKGRGHPLILIHGLGASLDWWQPNIDSLSRKHRVIAFDFLGFGLSSKPELKFSINLASDFMLSFLDAFQIQKTSLIGNSMGGLIALYTAMNAPDRIDRLVLVDSAGFGQELSIFLRIGSIFPLGEMALAMRSRLTAKMFLSRLVYDLKKVPESLFDCVLRMFSQPRAVEVCLQVLRYAVNLKGLRKEIWLPVVERAPSLPHKTLIVWGEDDRITPLSQARLGIGLMKHGELRLFEKCGHIPQIEQPDEFNSAVLDFLEK